MYDCLGQSCSHFLHIQFNCDVRWSRRWAQRVTWLRGRESDLGTKISWPFCGSRLQNVPACNWSVSKFLESSSAMVKLGQLTGSNAICREGGRRFAMNLESTGAALMGKQPHGYRLPMAPNVLHKKPFQSRHRTMRKPRLGLSRSIRLQAVPRGFSGDFISCIDTPTTTLHMRGRRRAPAAWTRQLVTARGDCIQTSGRLCSSRACGQAFRIRSKSA